jgi:hydrogenase maturation protease
MTAVRILVAGVGNVFAGDDAFGVEVARRLAGRPLPEGVRVADFGVRGFDLACALIDGCDAAILVDVAARGGPPGSLYVIDASADDLPAAPSVDGHALDPVGVLALARRLGGPLPPVHVVACEPARLFDADDDVAVGLSDPVSAAIEPAMDLVAELVDRARSGPDA